MAATISPAAATPSAPTPAATPTATTTVCIVLHAAWATRVALSAASETVLPAPQRFLSVLLKSVKLWKLPLMVSF